MTLVVGFPLSRSVGNCPIKCTLETLNCYGENVLDPLGQPDIRSLYYNLQDDERFEKELACPPVAVHPHSAFPLIPLRRHRRVAPSGGRRAGCTETPPPLTFHPPTISLVTPVPTQEIRKKSRLYRHQFRFGWFTKEGRTPQIARNTTCLTWESLIPPQLQVMKL